MSTQSPWKQLYKLGGIAALIAAILFRRNIGAEVSLFTGTGAIPQSAADWYALLLSNPFVSLAFLAVFDLANYILVGLMFLALCAALWQGHESAAVVAAVGGLAGVVIALSSNISLTMLSLSRQYIAATSEVKKSVWLAAGESLLATHDASAGYPGTGLFVSLLLIALAGLLFSAVMLQSRRFSRPTAIVGLLASACDLVYCLTFAFAPYWQAALLAGGELFWMLWHLLTGLRLLRLSKD